MNVEEELLVQFVKVCWALVGAFFDELDSEIAVYFDIITSSLDILI